MKNISKVPKYACILDEGSGEYIVSLFSSKKEAAENGQFFISDDCEEPAIRFYLAKIELIAAHNSAPTVQKE